MPFDFNNATDRDGIKAFFELVWRDTMAYVHLACSAADGDDWEDYRKEWPQYKNVIIDWCVTQNALGRNVYYCPSLFDIDKVNASTHTFVKENFLGSYQIWVEHDGNAPPLRALEATETDATLDLVPSTGDASEDLTVADTPRISKLSAYDPSLVVQSGHDGFEHRYWFLVSICSDIETLETVNRRATYDVRSDTSGWDATQLLRVPFTRNYKYEDKPPVTVSYFTNIEYEIENFGTLPPVHEVLSLNIDENNLPSVRSLALKYQWSNEEFDFFEKDVPAGERSDALMRWAYICAEKGLDEVEIYAMVENADSRWKKYTKRLDRKKRLLDIVNRALIKHPKSLSSATFDGLKGTAPVSDRLEIHYQYNDLIDEPDEEIEWALTDFIDFGSQAILAASPGVGKTSLSLQFANSCALGERFLRWEAISQMRMLFFSLEMNKGSLRKFMRTQRESYELRHTKILQENLRIIPTGQAWPFEIKDARTAFEDQVKQFEPKGIVIDSLGKLTNSKLDEETVRVINNFLAYIRNEYNCFVWIIHHNRKATPDNKHPNTGDDIYGSMYIVAESTLSLTLSKATPTSKDIRFTVIKNRLAEEIEPLTLHRGTDLLYSIKNEIPQLGGENGRGKQGFIS